MTVADDRIKAAIEPHIAPIVETFKKDGIEKAREHFVRVYADQSLDFDETRALDAAWRTACGLKTKPRKYVSRKRRPY